MGPQTENPAIAAVTAITKMVSTSSPVAGFWVIFYGAGSMQKIEKFFVRQQIACIAGRGESLQTGITAAGFDV